MRNPSRTLQNSIFEPLYSHQEELHFQSIKPAQASSSDWLSQNHSSPFSLAPPSTKPSCTMQRAVATTAFNDSMSPGSDEMSKCERERELELTACDHAVLGMHSPSGSSSITSPSSPSYSAPPCRSRSSCDVGGDHDDGSVASKLLASITKSISSPSLLACCKEAARETPYQKTLRLRKMKLQHCAEELGSESCDGLPCDGDDNNIFDSFKKMSSSQSTGDFSKAHQESGGNASPMMISVRSSPNLGCASLVSKHSSQIKERSFPPPLSHTLPRSASSDSFSYSLRAYREDGRVVLKEVKVPCRQYFQASRKDGRLTLQRVMTDEDFESKLSDEAHKECKDLQEDDNTSVCDAAANVAADKSIGGSCSKVEVESAETANLVGELEVCRVKASKKSGLVGMDNMEEREKVECLCATLSSGNCGSGKNDKANCSPHVGASSTIESDLKAAKRKACYVRASKRHLLCTLSKQQPLIHPPAKSPRLKVGHFDVAKFPQCAGSLGWESKSTRGVSIVGEKTLQSLQIMSASLQKLGYGVGKGASSTTIIFKDVSAKSLMENVTKLVASFRLDGGKLPCGEEIIRLRELDKRSCNSGGIMESSMWKGIKSIDVGVREPEDGSHKSISGLSVDVGCERRVRCCGACREGGCVVAVERSCLPSSSSCQLDVKATSSTSNQAALQGKEWLHTLHCKEPFHRSLGKGAFMKLHCVA